MPRDYSDEPSTPGWDEERIPEGGDIREWARASNPDYRPDMGVPPLHRNPPPADYNIAQDGPAPPEADIGEEVPNGVAKAQDQPLDIRKFAANANAKTAETLQAPTQVDGTTYKDFIWDLTQRGLSPGEAVGWWQRLYEAGDPSVKNQAGADDFYRRIPSRPERFAEQTALGFVKPFIGAAEFVGGLIGKENLDKVWDYIPGAELGVLGTDVTSKGLEEASSRQVPLVSQLGLKAEAINSLPSMIGSLPAWDAAAIPATALITKGLLRLPRYAEVAAEIAKITGRSRLGQALIEPSKEIAKRYVELSRIANVGGQTIAGGAVAAAEHQDFKAAASTTLGLMLVGNALGFGGRYLGKAIGWYEPNNLAKILHYISNRTGVPATTLSQDMNHFGQIYSTLVDMKAPDSVLKTFMDGVPGAEWNKTVGEQFGKYLADVGVLKPEIEKVMSFLPKEAQDKVFSSWGKVVKEKFIQQEWGKDLAGAPAPLPINTVPVHPIAEDVNGAQVFRSPTSRLAAGVAPITRPFQNPLVVTYDPAKELWSEAVIREQSRPTALGKQALYLLNRYRFDTPAEYKAVADELAMRVAGKSGYRSIFAQGKTPNDTFYVDLMTHKGGDVNEVVTKIEANLNKKAESFFNKYPMILGPVAGAAIGAGLVNPPESKAINLAPAVKAVAKFGVPIAVGYGLYPDKADAAMLPGPLRELVTKLLGETRLIPPTLKAAEREISQLIDQLGPKAGLNEIGKKAIQRMRTMEDVVNQIHAESPTTGYLFENILERRSAIHGNTSLDSAITDYERVLNSLKEPLEIRPSFGDDAIPTTHVGRQVYHGTKAAFEEFDPAKADPRGLYGPGTYVTSNPEIAGGYAKTKHVEGEVRPNIRPMKIREDTEFLDMEERIPLKLGHEWKGVLKEVSSGYVDDLTTTEYVDDMISREAPMSELYNIMTGTGFSKNKLNKMIGELGYDGITHVGGKGDKTHHRVWILFNPKDLETAHGLAVTPTKAWARPIWEPTVQQEVARNTFPPDARGPWQAPDIEAIRFMRKQRWGKYGMETFKTPTEYGAPIEKSVDAGTLEFEIGHDLAGRISRIGGYIDPVDKHWYVSEKEAADWGLGKAALDSLVAGSIAAGFIKGIKKPFLKLALVAAATGAATLLGAGEADAMPPWGKLFGIGPKGLAEADNFVREIAGAATREGVEAATNNAKKIAVERTPTEFKDAAEALFAAGDIAPERAFPPEFRDIFTLGHDPNVFLTTASDAFKLPAYAIDDPEQVWVRMHSNFIIRKEAELTGVNSMANEAVRHLDEIFKDSKVDTDELLAASYGLERDSVTNSLRQTNPDVSAEATAIARRLTEEIDDPIFQHYHGIHPQAQAVIRDLGLPETEDTWKLLRWLQELDVTQGIPNWSGRKVTAAEIIASEKTKGMLRFEAYHDLDTASSKNGILSKFPLANEQAQLLREIKRLSDEYPNGVPQEEGKKVLAIKTRLMELKAKEASLRVRKNIELGRLGKKHFWGPRAESKELGLRLGLENDPRKIMAHYIHGALGQAFFNHELHFFRAGATWFDAMGQKDAAAYMRRFLNTHRGLRSVQEDAWWASRWNRINQATSKIVGYEPNLKTVQSVRNVARNSLQLMYLGKLALNPAFVMANLTQTILTGAVLPTRFLIQAIPKALAAVLTNNALMQEVASSGILRATSHYAEEMGGASGKVMKGLDYAPNKSEAFNRALVYQAGKVYALDRLAKGKLRIQKHIAPYFDHSVLEKNSTPEEVAKAYGAAAARSTQFLQGPEGRPLMFSGGAARQVWGQFRSFQAGYANLLLATLKDDKPAFARLLGSLITLGGLSALPFGDNIKNGLRAGVAAAGGDPNLIPEGSILGKVYEVLMGNESPIQITGAVTPINYQSMNPFGDMNRFASWVGGPTVGTGLQAGKSLMDYGLGKTGGSEAFTGVVKPLFPGTLGVAGLEALQESGVLKELMDSMNYRGGIYSPIGEPLVRQRSDTDIALRAMNLQPSVRSQRGSYKYEIISAIESGDYTRAKELIEKAQKAGFIFDKRDIGNMKSILARKKSLQRPNQEIPK